MLMSKDARLISNTITNVGCIAKEQALEILRHGDSRDKPNFDPEKTIYTLIVNRYIKIVNKLYLTAIRNPKMSSEAVDCFWVMLDQIKQEDEDGGYHYNYSDIEQIIMGDAHIQFSYIMDEDVTINMLELNSENVSKMMAIQQRFYAHTKAKVGNEKFYRINHVIVTRDKKTAKVMGKYDLNIPYNIAYLDYGEEGNIIPTIEYI